MYERRNIMDTEKLLVVMESSYPPLFSMANRILKHAHDAEDAVQTAYLKAWMHKNDVLDGEHYEAWLSVIVKRECFSILRTRYRKAMPCDDALFSTFADPFDQYAALIRFMDIRTTMAGMSSLLTKPVLLRYVWGYSVKDVAVALNIPKGTVCSRMSRARHYLQKTTYRSVC